MSRTLEAAIARLEGLPLEEQERIGRWILEQLRDEDAWDQEFGASPDALRRLAEEARADHDRLLGSM
jgi:hypothetical protein